MSHRLLVCLLFTACASSYAQPAHVEGIEVTDPITLKQQLDYCERYDLGCYMLYGQVITKDTLRRKDISLLINEPFPALIVGNAANGNPQARATSGQGIGAADAVADLTGRYLYVASDGSNEISAYRIDPASGEQFDVPGAPFKSGKSPTGLALHPSNRFLYSANFDGNSVSAFAIEASTGALTLVGTTSVAAIPGSLAVHPSGRVLYVTSAATPGASVVQAYSIDTASGALSPLGAPISPLNFPASIVVDPQGKFVYFISNGIEGYAVSASGTLSKLAASPFPTISARQLAMAPSGKFLYAFSRSARTVSVFAIDRTTGTLTAVGNPILTGSNPLSMRLSPGGRTLLVADPGSLIGDLDRIWAYIADATTGRLSAFAGSPFATNAPATPDLIGLNILGPHSFASQNAAYSNSSFTAAGGRPPYAWSISGAALPPGLALDPSSGAITGVPTLTGTFEFTVKVADANGASATRATFITVNATGLPGDGRAPSFVVEFYNAALDHYFITWVTDEVAKLDAGTVIKGWARTGYAFTTYVTPQSGTSPVCRYYIPPGLGDSHFFGRGTSECNQTGQKNPAFVLEDAAFMQMFLPAAGACPASTRPVYRVFSNRADANHRYMTDPALRTAMAAKGWLIEGDGPDFVVMCAPN